MSKKIIAIALFATMVLSLFTVANAGFGDGSWHTSTDIKFGVFVYNVSNDGTADDDSKDANLSVPKDFTVPVTTESGKTTTLKGKYDDFRKVSSLYSASNQVKYAVDIVFPGYNPNDTFDKKIELTSFTGKSGTPTLVNLLTDKEKETSVFPYTVTATPYGIRYVFTLAKGGNEQKIVLRGKDANGYIFEFEHTIKFEDKTGSAKPVKDLSFDIVSAPTTDGIYHAYVQGGILFIQVAKDISYSNDNWVNDVNFNADDIPTGYTAANADLSQIYQPLGFEFYADGARVPVKNKAAYVVKDSDRTTSAKNDKFFAFEIGNYYTDSTAYKIKNDATAELPINLTAQKGSFKIAIEDEDYIYQSPTINVVWRSVPRNEITNVVIAERNITIKVGEKYKVSINKAHATTYSKINLFDDNKQDIVYIDGLEITGLAVGTTTLFVTPNTVQSGTDMPIIDTITVNVVAAGTTPPVADEYTTYRVISSGNLNIRSGAGTNYPIVGKASQNTLLKGKASTVAGWIQLENGTFVSAQYVVAVSASTTGNFVTTASNLNVRQSANGKITTKYPAGTTVTVTGYDSTGKWAQLDNGLWVSTSYLRAI